MGAIPEQLSEALVYLRAQIAPYLGKSTTRYYITHGDTADVVLCNCITYFKLFAQRAEGFPTVDLPGLVVPLRPDVFLHQQVYRYIRTARTTP